MKKKIWNLPLTSLSGILVIAFYSVFTIISIVLYPTPVSATTHYLSDLGSFRNSPHGAIFYVLACVLTGAAMFPFFIGLSVWNLSKNWNKILLRITQTLGCCSAFALIMIGVFSDDFTTQHLFWSDIFFVFNISTLILLGISLYNHPNFIKIITYYGFAVAILSFLFLLYTTRNPLIEWFAVFTALGDVGLVIFSTYRMVEN